MVPKKKKKKLFIIPGTYVVKLGPTLCPTTKALAAAAGDIVEG